MDRVEIIERTLRCYHAGWWSLVPILGLVPAIIAFYTFGSIRAATKHEWNPAAAQLRIGFILAIIGSALSLLLLSIPVLTVLF